MEVGLFEQIANQIAPFAYDVYLYLGGESLLHPELARMIGCLKERRIRTILHTNATLLNEEKAREILEADVDLVSFSIDGYEPETYEQIRVGARFDKTVAKVKNYLRLKKRMGIETQTVIQTIRDGREDLARRDAFRATFDGLEVDFYEIPAHNWGGKISEKHIPNRKPKSQYSPCARLWSTISILWDGTVVPCCADFTGQYPLGDVKKDDLLSIWNGKQMISLRQAMIEKRYREIELCADCDFLWRPKVLDLPSAILGPTTHVIRDLIGQKLYRRIERKIRLD